MIPERAKVEQILENTLSSSKVNDEETSSSSDDKETVRPSEEYESLSSSDEDETLNSLEVFDNDKTSRSSYEEVFSILGSTDIIDSEEIEGIEEIEETSNSIEIINSE